MPRTFTDPWSAYSNDPSFRRLVDALLGLISAADFTPSEIRQAAICAAIKWEQMNPLPALVFTRVKSDPFETDVFGLHMHSEDPNNNGGPNV